MLLPSWLLSLKSVMYVQVVLVVHTELYSSMLTSPSDTARRVNVLTVTAKQGRQPPRWLFISSSFFCNTLPQRGQRTHLKVDSGSVVIGVFHSGFIAGSSSLGPHSQRYVKATVASDSSRERFSHSSCFFSTPVLPQNSKLYQTLILFSHETGS